MAWTSPITWAVGQKLTAALMNTHLRDNLLYLKGLLDGSGTDVVTVPAALRVSNDANLSIVKSGQFAIFTMDTGTDDYFYDRTNNTHNWRVGGTTALSVDVTGKPTGKGFYDSGSAGVSLANGSTATVAHGLGAAPRFVFGVHGLPAGSMILTMVPSQAGLADLRITQIDATNITVVNNFGSTRIFRVFAML